MKNELTALREQLANKSQEFKVGGTNIQWQCGPQRRKVSFQCGTEHDMSPMALTTGV